MIRVVGVGGRNETQAAKSLESQILSYWPWVEHDPQTDIRLIVGTNCVGQDVEDIDLVLLAVFAQPPRIALLDCYGAPAGSYLLGSVCAVIELKEHRRDSVALQGDSLVVRYKDEWKSAVDQNRKQMHALRRFLEAKGVTRPFIQRFIWLKNVEQRELLEDEGADGRALPYLLFKNSTWRDILTSIWLNWRANNPNAQGFEDASYFINADISRRSPADFDGICRALTSEGLPLKPAVFEAPKHSRSAGDIRRKRDGLGRSRGGRLNRLSRVTSLSPALLIVGLIASLGSIMGLMNISRWMTTSSPGETSSTDTRVLTGFAGHYRCLRKSGMDLVTVSETADHLNISSGRGGAELWPVSENKFRAARPTTDFKGEVVFARDDKSRVLNLTILSDKGQRLLCPRAN